MNKLSRQVDELVRKETERKDEKRINDLIFVARELDLSYEKISVMISKIFGRSLSIEALRWRFHNLSKDLR